MVHRNQTVLQVSPNRTNAPAVPLSLLQNLLLPEGLAAEQQTKQRQIDADLFCFSTFIAHNGD
jgi:hypothetical protein